MIELTTTDGVKILLNPDLIECVEEGQETAIQMNSGRRYKVQESARLVLELIHRYQELVHALPLSEAGTAKGASAAVTRRKPTGEEVETGSEIGSLPD